MARTSLNNDGTLNDDGTPKTNTNSSSSVQNVETLKSAYGTEEIVGDDQDKIMCSFDPCKYNKASCKYIDNHGRCVAETCLFDKNETPVLTNQFWSKCIICNKEFSIDPREMKAYICDSCFARIHAAEVLPFTCIHCGKTQDHPSKLMFSRICDECFDYKLFNDVCKNFARGDKHAPA